MCVAGRRKILPAVSVQFLQDWLKRHNPTQHTYASQASTQHRIDVSYSRKGLFGGFVDAAAVQLL